MYFPCRMAQNGFFTSVRQLAAKLDREMQDLTAQMGDSGRGRNSDEAILLLHELRREMNTLQVSVTRKWPMT